MTSLLTPLWDEKVEPFLDRKFDELADKVLALLPIMAAAAGHGATDEILDQTGLSDAAERIREIVNAMTPVGVHIPGLDDLGALFNRDPKL